MRDKMFSKSVKLIMLVLFTTVITACASNDQIKSGKVISANDTNASVYVSADSSVAQGEVITVRRLLPTNTVLEGEPLYSYQDIGKAVIESKGKARYLNIKTDELELKQGDIIELTE
jgi:hypothetical protein